MLTEPLHTQARAFADAHQDETLALLHTLGRIPAPSHQEERRAAFLHDWLHTQGAREAYIDGALNVVFPFFCQPGQDMVVIMAHMDTVFPELAPVELSVRDGRIYAPGIGDNTANLVHLLMAVKYAVQSGLTPRTGVLFVASSGEEGLGNLKGCRAIMERYGADTRAFIALDGSPLHCVNSAVGSQRYRITARTEGGHSYTRFGAPNAIAQLAEVICALYAQAVPAEAKSTFNVGRIEGGTTVNAIAAEASMLYELRSEDGACLARMEALFLDTLEGFRARGFRLDVDVLGIRPCGGAVDPAAQRALEGRALSILSRYGYAAQLHASSTDANIPLSMGIPSVAYGSILGGGVHTYGEWLDLASLPDGLMITLETVLQFFE